MFIRRATPADVSAIIDVHRAAFDRPGDGPVVEATLAAALFAAGDVLERLAFFVEIDGSIAGNVLCSRARIDDAPSIGLGPLGVLPQHQARGIGSALMHGVVAAADAVGEPALVLLGDPAYYARFGFELADPLGVQPPDPRWVAHFQLRRLNAWKGLRGTFHYARAFDDL